MSSVLVVVSLFLSSAFAQSLPEDFPATTAYYFKTPDIELSRGTVDTPASLTKLWTAHIGLDSLRLHAVPTPTVSWLRLRQHPGTVRSLTIDAAGTPEFDPTELIELLRQQGIKRILGEIIVANEHAYDRPQDMTEIKDSGYCYNAKVDSINFKRNCLSIAIDASGARSLDPDMTASIQTRVKMGSSYNGTRPHFRWLNTDKSNFEYVIDVWLKDESSRTRVDVLVPATQLWMQAKLTRLLNDAGILISAEASAQASEDSETFPLKNEARFGEILCKTLQDSINIYADSVFLSTGAATRDRAREQGFLVSDGSGLALQNKMPGAQIFRFLEQISSSDEFLFYQRCLPAAGETGTLKDRLKDFKGLLFAKTATLTGMSHLAGYYKDGNRWRPFVFMMKDPGLKKDQLRDLQDAALNKFLKNPQAIRNYNFSAGT